MGFSFKISTSAGVNIRTGPATDYKKVGAVANGTKLHADKTSNGWFHIDQGSYTGNWCCGKYCTKLADDASTSTTTANSPTNKVDAVPKVSSAESIANAKGISDRISAMVNNANTRIKDLGIDASMRLFGLPHQLISHNDPRISETSKLGRMFTETFILDAPLIYLKPGTTNYLPGMSKEEKYAYTSLFTTLAGDSDAKKTLATEIASLMNDDDLRYFDFVQAFSLYIAHVNLLCRIGAVFLGIDKYQVPWVDKGNVTYGTYDWRYYNFDATYNTVSLSQTKAAEQATTLAGFIKNTISNIDTYLADDKYLQFYIDANASFSEDASNSTTQSMVNQFTDQLSDIGKELQFVSGFTGADVGNVMNEVTGGTDSLIKSIATGDGAISTMLKRLTGTSSQLLAGSNFLAPDVWSDSNYGKNYSFTVSLSTPYGNKESWYLNIFVPLMHLLAMALPVQTSANTYSAPFLVRAFSPGWFSCDMGIIDSIGIEKGGSGDAWSTSGLPNELKVSISVKDLFSNLALPDGYSIKKFFNNNGLINFLMVNCGVDITKTGLQDKLGVIANLFTNVIGDIVDETVQGIWYKSEERLRNLITLYR